MGDKEISGCVSLLNHELGQPQASTHACPCLCVHTCTRSCRCSQTTLPTLSTLLEVYMLSCVDRTWLQPSESGRGAGVGVGFTMHGFPQCSIPHPLLPRRHSLPCLTLGCFLSTISEQRGWGPPAAPVKWSPPVVSPVQEPEFLLWAQDNQPCLTVSP